jgi:hypothetical protein
MQRWEYLTMIPLLTSMGMFAFLSQRAERQTHFG